MEKYAVLGLGHCLRIITLNRSNGGLKVGNEGKKKAPKRIIQTWFVRLPQWQQAVLRGLSTYKI